jgi:hypothetical protein
MPAWLNWGPKLARAKAGGGYGPEREPIGPPLPGEPDMRPYRGNDGPWWQPRHPKPHDPRLDDMTNEEWLTLRAQAEAYIKDTPALTDEECTALLQRKLDES